MIPHLHLIVADWVMAKYHYKMVIWHNKYHDYYQLNAGKYNASDTFHITNDEVYLFENKAGIYAYLKVDASNPDLFKLMEECIDQYWFREIKGDDMFIRGDVDPNPKHITSTDIHVEAGKVTLSIKLDGVDFSKYSNIGDDTLLKEFGMRMAQRVSELIDGQ